MSDPVEQHLERLAKAYREARYPGDLANDVLLRPMRMTIRWIGAAGAVAAMAAALLIVWRVSVTPAPTQLVINDTPDPLIEEAVMEDEITIEDVSLGEVPTVSLDGLSESEALAPPEYGFSFSMPSISFVSDENSNPQTSTTQEAV